VGPVTRCCTRVPAGPGGAEVTRVARGKFDASIGPALEYRISYVDARPRVPSSPGAVHRNATLWVPVEVAFRSVTWAGAVVSGSAATVYVKLTRASETPS